MKLQIDQNERWKSLKFLSQSHGVAKIANTELGKFVINFYSNRHMVGIFKIVGDWSLSYLAISLRRKNPRHWGKVFYSFPSHFKIHKKTKPIILFKNAQTHFVLSCLLDFAHRSDRLCGLKCCQNKVVEFLIHYVNGLLPPSSRFKAEFLLTASTQYQAVEFWEYREISIRELFIARSNTKFPKNNIIVIEWQPVRRISIEILRVKRR